MGKAKNLINRVRSYFAPPTRLGPKTQSLVSRIHSLDFIEVSSEVEALLLESRLIKKFRPQYNIAAKDDKSPYYIHLTSEAFPKPVVNHLPTKALAGPFLSGYVAKSILKHFRKIAPYCTAPRPVKRPCLYSHLNLCNPCPATSDRAGYLQNIARLRRLLSGQFTKVAADLTSAMRRSSKASQFEQAAVYRDHLQNLSYLSNLHISPDDYLTNPNLLFDQRQAALSALHSALLPYLPQLSASLHRIELYDNAHLMGTSPTSAMVVAIDGDLSTKNYRHFTLKNTNFPSDVSMMAEVLSRRLANNQWPKPDLIVLDGGLPQLSALSHLQHHPLPPVIALAKREEIIYFSNSSSLKLPLDHLGLRLLMRLRDEAHRFSRRLHFKHRRAIIMRPS